MEKSQTKGMKILSIIIATLVGGKCARILGTREELKFQLRNIHKNNGFTVKRFQP